MRQPKSKIGEMADNPPEGFEPPVEYIRKPVRRADGTWMPGRPQPISRKPTSKLSATNMSAATRRKLAEYLLRDVGLACEMTHNELLRGNPGPYLALAKILIPREDDGLAALNVKQLVIESTTTKSLDAMRADLLDAMDRRQARQLAAGGVTVYPVGKAEPDHDD